METIKPFFQLTGLCFFLVSVQSSCSQRIALPQIGNASQPANLSDGNTGNASYNFNTDDEHFYTVRESEKKLNTLVNKYTIPKVKSNAEFGSSNNNLRTSIFNNIQAIDNELYRLYNQPKPKPVAKPSTSNNDKKVQDIKEDYESKLAVKDQEILNLRDENSKLKNQVAQLAKSIGTPSDAASKTKLEETHSCRLQNQKDSKISLPVSISENTITFNYKVREKDILSKHPQNSYSVLPGKYKSVMTILQPTAFWGSSKELIVKCSKSDHKCFNGDPSRK